MAKQFVCSFLLLIAATGAFALDVEGGTSTTTSKRNYVVALRATDGSYVCGGALISSTTVVTAGWCVANYDVSKLVVTNGDKTVKISKSQLYPKYDPITNGNDLGVLKLAEPLSGGTIKLASKQPKTGASGIVSAWNTKKKLFDLTKSFITTTDCLSGKYSYTTDDELGAVVCGLGKACGGLAGDPYVVSNKLVGVTSSGYGCSNNNNPTVYTDIAASKSWLDSITKSW